MKENISKHFWHYLVYAVILGGGLYLISLTKNDAYVQEQSLFLIVFLYFTWAMVHHYVHHQLHQRIVVEYILIVLLGTLLALFIFRA